MAMYPNNYSERQQMRFALLFFLLLGIAVAEVTPRTRTSVRRSNHRGQSRRLGVGYTPPTTGSKGKGKGASKSKDGAASKSKDGTASKSKGASATAAPVSKGKGKGASSSSSSSSTSTSTSTGTSTSTSTSTSSESPTEGNVFEHSTSSISTEAEFVLNCYSSMLEYGMSSTEYITEDAANDLLNDVCDQFDADDVPYLQCPSTAFEDLNQSLRTSVVWYMCPSDQQSETTTCLTSLNLDITDVQDTSTSALHEDSIRGFCCGLLPYVESAGLEALESDSTVCTVTTSATSATYVEQGSETASPTASPTMVRGVSPVSSPTAAPTDTPVATPTASTPTTTERAVTTDPPTANPRADLSESAVNADTPTTLSMGGTIGIVLGSAAVALAILGIVSRRYK
eukprot:Nitzschia sp. Nitz4//scaffold22_size323478//310831//312024//NITZ4_000595-RA/size323478-processed-gene-0.131-mRNA-1//-1//CDS//3329543201//2569//frame0